MFHLYTPWKYQKTENELKSFRRQSKFDETNLESSQLIWQSFVGKSSTMEVNFDFEFCHCSLQFSNSSKTLVIFTWKF